MKNFHGSSGEVSDNGAQKIISEAIIACISFYQKTFSPDHGIMRTIMKKNHCRFYPSCSAYAIQALRQYGLSKGLMVSVRRVFTCNPMHRGGYDPVMSYQ